jgi:hypothetical protein
VQTSRLFALPCEDETTDDTEARIAAIRATDVREE